MDYQQLWLEVIERLCQKSEKSQKSGKAGLNDENLGILKTLKTQVSLTEEPEGFILWCRSQVIKAYIPRFEAELREELRKLCGRRVPLYCRMGRPDLRKPQNESIDARQEFTDKPIDKPSDKLTDKTSDKSDDKAAAALKEKAAEMPIHRSSVALNKTFDNFVPDPQNQALYEQAREIAAAPGGQPANPFYIFGDSGLGKTHLLCSIINDIRNRHPDKRLMYQRAEDFVSTFTKVMTQRRTSEQHRQMSFREIYTAGDVFVIDDLQNLCGAPRTREAFCEIVNEFIERPGRQLVLASLEPPTGMSEFSDRLKSRLTSGVCRRLCPPSVATRVEIAACKCREYGVELPEEVLCYVASHARADVRSLEGAIKTLAAQAKVGGTLGLAEVAELLSGMFDVGRQILSIDTLKNRVAEHCGVSVEAMESAQRKREISRARALAMTLAQDLIPEMSLKEIARSFIKDHSSVLEAIRRTRARLLEDVRLESSYRQLRDELRRA